jgi:hypothetical protein
MKRNFLRILRIIFPINHPIARPTAIEVKEVQNFPKYCRTEYVEDFGYSHGSQLACLYPGKSNTIDGYLVHKESASLSVEKACVEFVFNGKTTGVWKLGQMTRKKISLFF